MVVDSILPHAESGPNDNRIPSLGYKSSESFLNIFDFQERQVCSAASVSLVCPDLLADRFSENVTNQPIRIFTHISILETDLS